jgi:hypothetical protein
MSPRWVSSVTKLTPTISDRAAIAKEEAGLRARLFFCAKKILDLRRICSLEISCAESRMVHYIIPRDCPVALHMLAISDQVMIGS